MLAESNITHKLDGIYRAVDDARRKYLGYRFLVYTDKDTLQVIPAKHGALPSKVRASLDGMVQFGFIPEIVKQFPKGTTDEHEVMVLLNFMQFMVATMFEKNPKIVHMAMYTYDRFDAFKKLDWSVEIFMLNVELPNRVDIFAGSFDRKRLEHLY